MFQQMYQFTIKCSAHRLAPWYLGLIAFIESSFFPIPPDVMLISMGLAKPKNAWRYALIATMCSVLGGMFGYLIGYFLFDLIYPWLSHSSWNGAYLTVNSWFKQYGVWAVIVAGFTPIPYKLFTIGAGAAQMPFIPFVLGSIVGRGMRFYLVSTLFYFFGERLEKEIFKWIDKLAWGFLAILFIGYLIYRATH
jgi:membrane protein YqaA with SNARE-associated domain